MKRTTILIAVLIPLFLLTCKQSTKPLLDEGVLDVTVIDENGKQLSGVGLHFYMELVSDHSITDDDKNILAQNDSLIGMLPSATRLEQNYPNPFNPTTVIRFALPKAGNVKMEILSVRDSSVLATLINQTLNAGYHAVQWNGQNDSSRYLTNNIYLYRLTTEDFSETKELCLNMADPEHIRSLNCLPIASSDQNGKITLEYDYFPIGHSVTVMDETGNELALEKVSSNFRLFFLKDGYKTAVKEINIDPDKGIGITVTLEKE